MTIDRIVEWKMGADTLRRGYNNYSHRSFGGVWPCGGREFLAAIEDTCGYKKRITVADLYEMLLRMYKVDRERVPLTLTYGSDIYSSFSWRKMSPLLDDMLHQGEFPIDVIFYHPQEIFDLLYRLTFGKWPDVRYDAGKRHSDEKAVPARRRLGGLKIEEAKKQAADSLWEGRGGMSSDVPKAVPPPPVPDGTFLASALQAIDASRRYDGRPPEWDGDLAIQHNRGKL